MKTKHFKHYMKVNNEINKRLCKSSLSDDQMYVVHALCLLAIVLTGFALGCYIGSQ